MVRKVEPEVEIEAGNERLRLVGDEAMKILGPYLVERLRRLGSEGAERPRRLKTRDPDEIWRELIEEVEALIEKRQGHRP
ncbi:MAG: hypothetical protein GXO28_04495 [Methanopyri archaeon]|nr:hypothetical protein [Methanopyri archaeon]